MRRWQNTWTRVFTLQPGVVRRRFDELDEDSARRFGVHERDAMSARPRPGRRVDHGHAEPLQERNGLIDPLDFDGDVVQAGPALFEKAYESFVSSGSDELETGRPDGQKRHVRLLGGYPFALARREAE